MEDYADYEKLGPDDRKGYATINDKGELVTSGGRVLCVVGLGGDLHQARDKAYKALDKVHFDGMQYRKDIGHRAL